MIFDQCRRRHLQRLFMMFASPPDMSAEWSDSGVEAATSTVSWKPEDSGAAGLHCPMSASRATCRSKLDIGAW